MASEKEFEGATLQEALDKASKALGIPEPKLHYRVLDTGRRGLWGLGARSVRIAIEAPEDRHQELLGVPPPARGTKGRARGARAGGREDPPGPAAEGRRDQGGRGRREAEGGRDARGAEGEGRRPPKRRRRGRGNRQRGEGRSRQEKSAGGAASAPRRRQEGDPDGRAPRASRGAPPVPVDPAHVDDLRGTVERMLELMSLDLRVEAHTGESGVRLQLSGGDEELLLAKEAEFLVALQFVLNRMARRAWPTVGRVQLSCDGYRSRRDQEIVDLAKEVAGQVARTGAAKHLQPLNPYERRLVHLTVREFDDLTSESEGDGFLKKIRIAPR